MTAANYYLRAGNYYFTGERFIAPGEQKLAIVRKALRCFHAGFERRHPQYRASRRALRRLRAARRSS